MDRLRRASFLLLMVVAAFVSLTGAASAAGTPPPPWPTLPATSSFIPHPSSFQSGTLPATELPPIALPQSHIPITAAPPESASIDNLLGRKQSLPLSCESRSAADWAAYFGVNIGELAFFGELPASGDPDKGFVGDVRGKWGQLPPAAYGVHAGPVARLLRQYGLPASYQIYMRWESVQVELAAGRPVIVWVVGHVDADAGVGQLYTAPDGHRTVVAPFEHTVIVTGYDRDSVTVEDEGRRYTRPLDVFLQSWGALRNMAITAQP